MEDTRDTQLIDGVEDWTQSWVGSDHELSGFIAIDSLTDEISYLWELRKFTVSNPSKYGELYFLENHEGLSVRFQSNFCKQTQ